MENDDEILTMSEAAAILKLSEEQVYELCRSRAQARAEFPFPAFSISRRAKRVRKCDLMAWVNSLATRGIA